MMGRGKVLTLKGADDKSAPPNAIRGITTGVTASMAHLDERRQWLYWWY